MFATLIVFSIGTPLLVYATLTELKIDPGRLWGNWVLRVEFIVLKIEGLFPPTHWSSVTMPNSVNVGLPLCYS